MGESVSRGKKPPTTKVPQENTRSTTPSGTLLLPTGCSLLNLALSGSVDGGYGAGRIVNMIGDSSAGKSMLSLTGMAEMANDARFDDYVLLYDGVEPPDFDIRRLFGTKLQDRLDVAHQYVAKVCGLDEYYPPETIQQYYGRMLQLIDGGHPVFAVLDSFDAVTTTEELARANDMVKGKETGSYKMEKARWASEILRVLSRKIEDAGSAIVIVSQTRDNIEPIGFQKKTRAGGKALEFYACHIFWLAKMGNIASPNKMKIGSKVLAKTTKNKLTGKWRDVQFPIYYQIGVDDIGATVDYLVDNSSEWKKTGPTVTCDPLGLKGHKTAVVKEIEESPEMWATVKQQLQETWDAQEAKADLGRKPRFE